MPFFISFLCQRVSSRGGGAVSRRSREAIRYASPFQSPL